MSVLLEFSMFPTDVGESKSEYVSKILDMIDKSGVPYKLTPMSTVVETDTIEEALEIIKKSYEILEPHSNRVYSALKFDIRKNRKNRMKAKIASVSKHLQRDVNS